MTDDGDNLTEYFEKSIRRTVAEDRERRAREAEERLDAPLTRRDLLDAIESVRREYGISGTEEAELIEGAFRKLAEALR